MAIIGKYGITQNEVDEMFATGEWLALPHRTRSGQWHIVGPSATTSEAEQP
jgi:hypothetical protein